MTLKVQVAREKLEKIKSIWVSQGIIVKVKMKSMDGKIFTEHLPNKRFVSRI
jgi:hypothetical protein